VSRRRTEATRSGALREWLAVARERGVVLRACKYAVIVGAVLVTINHGDALVAGEIDARRLFKIALTVLVPYVVSTLSSVGATLALRRDGA
jgi:hypothetical protein